MKRFRVWKSQINGHWLIMDTEQDPGIDIFLCRMTHCMSFNTFEELQSMLNLTRRESNAN